MAVARSTSRPRPFIPDERQQQAIEHVHGPMLVIAGAGTGKTTVLTRRIAGLIRAGHSSPADILAVTYTKNAAQEMRERVREELGRVDLAGLRIATFHEYCNDLLLQSGRRFGVLDEQDLWIYLRRRLRELQLNYFVRAANVGKFLEDLLTFMRRCHDELVSPEDYAAYVRKLERRELPIPRVTRSKDIDAISDEEVLDRCREIAAVFATVERMLREDNLGTFGHMITHAYHLLREEAVPLARPRFILVDEFQDVNFAQVKVLRLLAGTEENVFAVGDPDQAIYHFRGASSAAFLLFHRHFPRTRLVQLEKNRRSTSPILNSAFALISKNPNVFDRASSPAPGYHRAPLISAREEDAAREGQEMPRSPVEVVILAAKDAESAEVVTRLRQWQRKTRGKWKDCAVLYRTHLHRDQVAAELAREGIPFSIENMDVMDMPEARDLFACLGAVVSEADGASLFRVAALPQFAIDPEKLRAGIRALPRDAADGAIASVLSQIDGGPQLLALLRQTREQISSAGALGRAALDIIVRNFSLQQNSRPVKTVLEFVAEWQKKAITRTGEIGELLDYLEYFREAGGVIPLASIDENAVRLMTVHAAKGLEFSEVSILRASSPSFPAAYKEPLLEFPRELESLAVAPLDDKDLHKQEERRLFYVSMTRAKNGLTIFAKQGAGSKDPTPPGFLRDLLKDISLLGRWLVQAPARGLQTDMFAQAADTAPLSRASQWLSLPPASDLHSKLSASAVQTYETCPLQFMLEREWNIPGEIPAAMQYGASMHRVLHAYYDSVRKGRPLEDDVLLQLFRDDLARACIQDRYQHDLYLKQGNQQLLDFLAACRRAPVPKVLHAEEYFNVKVGEISVAGRIDRIDQLTGNEVVITDYKTGKAQSQEDSDESLQLSIYALAAREKWGYRARHLVLYNLEGNSPVLTRRSESQLEEAKGRIMKVAEGVAGGHFEPKPGFYCRFCAYRNLCPATEKQLPEPETRS